MATTGSNGVVTGGTATTLNGTQVSTNPYVAAFTPHAALDLVNAGPPKGSGIQTFTDDSALVIDRVFCDFSLTTIPPGIGANILAFGNFIGGYALNGFGRMTLATTTTGDIDLTDITLAADSRITTAGDTAFGHIGCLVLINRSATVLTLKPGGSNPASFPLFAGTTPTLAVPAQVSGVPGILVMRSPTLVVVDSSHKILTVTPTAGGVMDFAVGGS